jgi:ketosteroid isomerase-like protein
VAKHEKSDSEKQTKMKSRRMIAGFVFLVFGAEAALGQARGKAEDAVLAADAAWEKVYAVKDLAKSVAFCDERASLLWPHMPIATGMAAVREAIAKDFAAGDLTWQANNVGIAGAGDLAYVSGAYQWKLKDASGKGFVDQGKYLTVWKKQADGSWKVLFDMFNSNLPLASGG